MIKARGDKAVSIANKRLDSTGDNEYVAVTWRRVLDHLTRMNPGSAEPRSNGAEVEMCETVDDALGHDEFYGYLPCQGIGYGSTSVPCRHVLSKARKRRAKLVMLGLCFGVIDHATLNS